MAYEFSSLLLLERSMAKKASNRRPNTEQIREIVFGKLKDTPEQQTVVGPLVMYLYSIGWSLDQMVFGKAEWRVPKSPSEQTKREKNRSFSGFPVDIAVFSDPSHLGDPRHLLFIIECK